MSIRERVRLVFLWPQEFYTRLEAAELLGWTIGEMDAAIREGDLEVTRTCSGVLRVAGGGSDDHCTKPASSHRESSRP